MTRGMGLQQICFFAFQLTIYINFFKSRPSKTGRTEGGLLCVRN